MTDLTPEKRAELRRLAEAATPGPFWFDPEDGNVWADDPKDGKRCRVVANVGSLSYADMAFVAAMDPKVVLSLLDALDAKDAELASVRALSEAERAVVDAAVERQRVTYSDDREDFANTCVALVKAVDALLDLRKDQTDGA